MKNLETGSQIDLNDKDSIISYWERMGSLVSDTATMDYLYGKNMQLNPHFLLYRKTNSWWVKDLS